MKVHSKRGENSMDMVAIVLGLVLLLVLTLKKVPVVIAALISIILIALMSGMSVISTVTDTYMEGFAAFVKNAWLMLFLGSILSKLMDISGAARSISNWIIGKMGEKWAIPAVILAGGLLTFGGVSSMVSCFALYPIALAVFKKANLPRYLMPAVIGSGIFTWVTMLPGNPSVQNILPTKYLPTTPMAAPVVGILAAAVTLVLTFLYFNFQVKKARKNNIGFEMDENTNAILEKADQMEKEGTLPDPLISILPIICIAVVLNVFNLDISVALLSGVLACCVLFFKRITGIEPLLKDSISSASNVMMTASAIVGIGSVVKAAPGFQKIVDAILGFSESGGNPILIFAIATTVLCGLNASGMGGLGTSLSALAEPFMAMGVNPDIMARIGVIASVGLDSLPHSGGIVATLSICGVSYKDGYKHLFVTTVLITLIALAVAVVAGNILYPVGL